MCFYEPVRNLKGNPYIKFRLANIPAALLRRTTLETMFTVGGWMAAYLPLLLLSLHQYQQATDNTNGLQNELVLKK